jgi:ribosomal protein L37AE/L43A
MRSVTCPKCGTPAEVPDGKVFAVRCDKCASQIPLRQSAAPADLPVAEVVADSLDPAARYDVSPLDLSPRGNPAALAGVAVAGVVVAVVLAGVCHLVGQHIWFVLVFPILHGLGVGVAVGHAGRLAKLRLPTGVMLVAGAAGGLSAGLIHVFDYLALAGPGASFLDFEHRRAQAGVQIADSDLGYTGSIIYWCFEIVVTLCAAGGFAVDVVRAPFCDGCRNWKPKRTIGPLRLDPPAVARALEKGTPGAAVAEGDESCRVTIEVYACPHCGEDADIDVKMSGIWAEGKTQAARSAYVTYPGDALPAFDALEDACRSENLVIKE